MTTIPNDVYVHVRFDAEKFSQDLRAAVLKTMGDCLQRVDKYLKPASEWSNRKPRTSRKLTGPVSLLSEDAL